jgi:hypothetical protein
LSRRFDTPWRLFLSTNASGPLTHYGLTPQVQNGTGRYRYLIPIGNGFVKHHE